MTEKEFLDYCLLKKGAYIDFPFGPEVCIIKVKARGQKGRIFAQLFELKGTVTITLNCSYEMGLYYRDMYPNIVTRGYHCPPIQQPYFNSMPLNGLFNAIIVEMIDHSYNTVVSKFPKFIQDEIYKL